MTKNKNAQLTSPPNPVPPALLAFRLRSSLGCQKQAGSVTGGVQTKAGAEGSELINWNLFPYLRNKV